jgi:hypothetical protein
VKELQRDHRGVAADRELHGEGADGAARAVDQQRVAHADGEAGHALAHRVHGARGLHAGDRGQRDGEHRLHETLPELAVDRVDARAHPQAHLAGTRLRHVYLVLVQHLGAAEPVEHDRLHDFSARNSGAQSGCAG